MEDDRRQRTYQDYTATVQNAIATMLSKYIGADWTIPSFISMVYPEQEINTDNRSAEEIYFGLIDRLKK